MLLEVGKKFDLNVGTNFGDNQEIMSEFVTDIPSHCRNCVSDLWRPKKMPKILPMRILMFLDDF